MGSDFYHNPPPSPWNARQQDAALERGHEWAHELKHQEPSTSEDGDLARAYAAGARHMWDKFMVEGH